MRTNTPIGIRRDTLTVPEETKTLLDKPLSLESALRIAALNNRDVQAILSEIKAASAERRRERLPLKPNLEAGVRFGDKENRGDYAVTEDVSNLLFYPLKWGLSGARFRGDRLRATAELMDLLAEVKKAYFRLTALEETRRLLGSILEGAEAAAELASRQRKAGTINALEQNVQDEIKQDAVVDLARVNEESASARQNFGRLLGLSIDPATLKLSDSLPPLPKEDPSPEACVRLALEGSPDLAAAQEDAHGARQALWLARFDRLPLRAGVALETEGSQTFLGPKVEVQIPLDLGWNSASKAKWESEAARHRLASAELRARAEVRAAAAHLAAARGMTAYYDTTVIPHRETMVNETQKQYNFMLEGVYQLLRAKQRVYSAYRSRIEAQRDYWFARAELERLIGGPLVESSHQGEQK